MVASNSLQLDLSQRSSYLKYLPAIYSQSDFLGRFLMIFESILGPIEGVLDNLPYYFDPGLVPQELLPWLASWLDLTPDESWPLDRQRELVKSALELHQWRGTARGLKEYIKVYTGIEPQITEEFGSMALGEHTKLGVTTVLGEGRQNTFTVTLELDDPASVNPVLLKAIIEAEKPAYAAYTLRIVPTGSSLGPSEPVPSNLAGPG